MSVQQELDLKLRSIRKIYKGKGKKGLLFEKQNNISWLLKGRSHVGLAAVNGVVDILVNDEDVYLIANNIEASRMVQEELPFKVTIKDYWWYEGYRRGQLIEELTGGNCLVDSQCEDELRTLRLVMTPLQIEDYKILGKDAAEVMNEACSLVRKGMTEFNAAALMAQKCMDRGMEPLVMLVAADERINAYRHPLPTSKVIDDYVMMVIGARRYGQIVCITRFVAFSEPSDEIKRRRDAVLNLDTMLLEETRPGIGTAKLFDMLVDGYKNEGFPDEWKLHHQGGITGYNAREYKVSFGIDVNVEAGQVYAWNPSITGFKAEDTFIVGQNENIILTDTKEMPYKEVKYNGKIIKRPDIFIRRGY